MLDKSSEPGRRDLFSWLAQFSPPTLLSAWSVRSLTISFAWSIVAVAVGVLVRITIFASLETRLVYVTLYPAVTAASVVGGLPAGILASALSALAASFWLAPISETMEYLGLAAFLASCALIISVTEAMHRARARAVAAEARARLSDAIRESEERQRTLIDQAADAIITCGAEGQFLEVNPAACQFFGYDQSHLLDLRIRDLLCREDIARFSGPEMWIRAGEGLPVEWCFRRSDGVTVIGEVSAKQYRSGQFQAIIRNVTERQRAAMALRESQTQLSAVVNNAVDGIVVVDETGSIRSVNPAAQRIFGYGSTEMIGRNVNILMAEPYRSAHDTYITNYLKTGNAKVIGLGREVEGRRKDGTAFPINLAISETEIDGKRVFVGFIRDISEQKLAQENQRLLTERLFQSEQQARQQQALFQGVFDSAPDAILLTGMNRRVRMINPAFQKLFGFTSQEVENTEDSRFFSSKEEWKRISLLTAEPQRNGGSGRENAEFLRKNGTTFPGQIISGHYRDSMGTALGYIAIVRDVIEELRREDTKRQSQKLEALGQLTGGIAHDFNNILTTIIGNHEYLEEHLTKTDERLALRRANNAAEMAARLTARLLTFARRRKLEPETINLNDVVTTIADLLRRTIGESITLELKLAHDLASVLVDVSEVENAIINLALNARDAMPTGGRLTITTDNLTVREGDLATGCKPGLYVALSVIDTGIGMTPEVAARAFEPFYSTKGSGRGTGLGLSAVYGFAEQSGGSVALNSELGRGTTVRFILPAVKQQLAIEGHHEEIPASCHGETVLVVEDDPDVRETTLRRIEGLGYVAIDATNGSEAVKILESGKHVDLVFSDVVMPGGMSGFELGDWIRQNRPNVRVLLTSGHANVGHPIDPALRQKFELLDKPYSRSTLAQAFHSILSEGR
jgi:PAS domain S-box-containing protein